MDISNLWNGKPINHIYKTIEYLEGKPYIYYYHNGKRYMSIEQDPSEIEQIYDSSCRGMKVAVSESIIYAKSETGAVVRLINRN